MMIDDDDQEYVDALPPAPRKDIAPDDLELLELAARAIGAVRFEVVDGEGYGNLHFEDGTVVYAWNSLVHSDDAFGLMVDLELDVMPSGAWVTIDGENQLAALVQDGYGIDEVEAHAGDAKAATRRAVTCAAAAIAKQRSA